MSLTQPLPPPTPFPQPSKFDIIAKIPHPYWAPLGAGLLILLAGGIGLAVHRAWLFASLAPTAYEQAELPENKTSRIYHVIVGHYVGLAAGFLAITLVGAWSTPNVLSTGVLTAPRVYACVLGIAITVLIALLLRASHPPAGATALLVALGAFTTWADVLNVVVGVAIVAVAGEVLRRLRLRRERYFPGATL